MCAEEGHQGPIYPRNNQVLVGWALLLRELKYLGYYFLRLCVCGVLYGVRLRL
jgi:hypothetical protein